MSAFAFTQTEANLIRLALDPAAAGGASVITVDIGDGSLAVSAISKRALPQALKQTRV